jgi:hypothetical protein
MVERFYNHPIHAAVIRWSETATFVQLFQADGPAQGVPNPAPHAGNGQQTTEAFPSCV